MATTLNYTVEEDGDVFIARCIELNISSDGLSRDEAVANLQEALDCYFANPEARLDWAERNAE